MSARDFAKPEFVKTIPAYPGFFVLDVLGDEHDYPVEAIRYPVVAWALESETLAPYPITLEGVQTGSVYILQPHGTVERPCIDGFANIDEWLVDQQAAFARKGAR